MIKRLKIICRGAVQGVGFRPFIFRIASEMNLTGWVNNSSEGVFIEAEGSPENLEKFLLRIEKEKPPRAVIQSLEFSYLDPMGFEKFEIRPSVDGPKRALILPDIAACPECTAEIFDPKNRRYQYPFTNCTNCGPRFSIIESIPYDRPNTTMKKFPMCEKCREEYENPRDRRFHAQPNACPECGPQLELWDGDGKVLAGQHEALIAAKKSVERGEIVAVKGLGGFHLMCDARNNDVVRRLRERKHREEKPFALMAPSLDWIRQNCEVNDLEERALLSPEAPIVILKKLLPSRAVIPLSRGVAPEATGCVKSSDLTHPALRVGPSLEGNFSAAISPNNPYLGVMLPYTPLHHLLMRQLGFPIVATSGNISDEPICIDEHEALERLRGIADFFLIHYRPIARHVDDSIVRIVDGGEMVLRRARGFAPLPIHLNDDLPSVLAVGGHLKNTVAVSVGREIFVSQHIGDLETEKSFGAFQNVIQSFRDLYEFSPGIIACDLHPGYVSTRFAQESKIPVTQIQHHYAHILSCMAENEIDAPALGVAWDGTGYGPDGTIWGGEFLRITENSFERFAHFRTFPLPGGEKGVKEPRRAALGVLYEIFGDNIFSMKNWDILKSFSAEELKVLRPMLAQKINCPLTSSAGRLFDAVASLAGLHQKLRFEGQAAMELEFLTDGVKTDDCYAAKTGAIFDWEPMILEILKDVETGIPLGIVSAKFHNALAEAIVGAARQSGEEKIVLSGGCFQNKYLTERAANRLREEGFRPYRHQRIPSNDGGIALGQVVAALRESKKPACRQAGRVYETV